MAEPRLTPQQELFLSFYLGECRYNATQAAEKAGYAHANKQGSRLLQKPAVKAALDEWKAAVRQDGIACQEARIAAQTARWDALHQIARERAADAGVQEAPGGKTGFVVRTAKLVKVYESSEDAEPEDAEPPSEGGDEALSPTKQSYLVYEFPIDTGLLKEMRDLEALAAKELGQITERKELTGPNGGPIEHKDVSDLRKLPPDELARLYHEALGAPA